MDNKIELKPEHYKDFVSFTYSDCDDSCKGFHESGNDTAECTLFRAILGTVQSYQGDVTFARCISCVFFFNTEEIKQPAFVPTEHVETLKPIME